MCSIWLFYCELDFSVPGCVARWFRVAGAGNRARQLKLLDFVALCEKSAVRVRDDVLGVAKSWQVQGIR